MEELKMLEILVKIKICVERDSLMIAKDLVNLEINNLKGITETTCQNTKYYYYDSNCKFCSNLNCSANKNNKLI